MKKACKNINTAIEIPVIMIPIPLNRIILTDSCYVVKLQSELLDLIAVGWITTIKSG